MAELHCSCGVKLVHKEVSNLASSSHIEIYAYHVGESLPQKLPRSIFGLYAIKSLFCKDCYLDEMKCRKLKELEAIEAEATKTY